MLQAFVSLKHKTPERTDSGLKSFFQGLVKASFSPPTYYCTNVDPEPRAFTIASAAKDCAVPECKWAQLRGEDPYYWQVSLLMPDKAGFGALFYHFESEKGDKPVIEAEKLVDFAKSLFGALEPRLMRLGDSEAREKLKSRHGLVLMPGLGRVEWLQLVHPDIYSELYNPSELAAAPAYQAEILPNGALFLRVYGDPKDWDNEENISLANFIPGFLAGTANVTDGEKAKQAVRQIEKLWTRASKTAGKIAEIFHPPAEAPVISEDPIDPAGSDATVKMSPPSMELLNAATSKPSAKEPQDQGEDAPVIAAEPVALLEPPSTSEVQGKISEIAPDVQLQGSISKVNAPDLTQPLYKGRDGRLPAADFFVAFEPEKGELRYLDKYEDFAAFLHSEELKVDADRSEIIGLVKKYHRTYVTHLTNVSGVPGEAGKDSRLDTFSGRVKAPYQDSDGETQKLHFWVYNPRNNALEELVIHQFKTWPLSMEGKNQLSDLKADTGDALPPPKNGGGDTFTDNTDTKIKDGEKKPPILLIVLLLVVVAAAVVYFTVLA